MENIPSAILKFLNILFKRKKTIALYFIVTGVTVAIGTYFKEPTFEAKAQILIKLGRENLYAPPNETGNLVKFTSEDQILPEIEMLQSSALAEKVIDKMGLKTLYDDMDLQSAVMKFQNSLIVTGNKTSNLITILFRHKNPKLSSMAVNTLVSVYLDQHLKIHKSPQSHAFFEEQAKIFKNKLETSEGNLSRFKSENNLTALDEEQNLLLNQIANLDIESNKLAGEAVETKNRIQELQLQLKDIPKNILQEEEVEHNPLLIGSLEEKLTGLELKEAELLTKYNPENRLVQNVRSEITVIRSKLSEQKSKRYGRSYTGPNTIYQQLQKNLLEDVVRQKAVVAKIDVVKSQLVELQSKLDKLNKIEVQFDNLKQSIEIDRQNYVLYLSKVEEARISNEMDEKKISNVNVIESANVPFQPVGPSKKMSFLFQIFLALIGGIALAFLLEYFNNTMDMPSEVENILQLPVIASIPDFKKIEFKRVT